MQACICLLRFRFCDWLFTLWHWQDWFEKHYCKLL